MKTFLIGLTLLFTMVACNKTPTTDYNEQRMEANEKYQDDMKDVQKEKAKIIHNRNEKINDAREELHKDQN